MSRNSAIKHLFLTGYMGSGKSTIGRLLAKELTLPFYDLDTETERAEGLSVPDIFEQKGEPYFRAKETEVLKQLIQQKKAAIIALGGGSIINPDNLDLCKANGDIIYLKASVQTLSERVKNNKESRPIIVNISTGDELNAFIFKHLEDREPFYNKADLILNVNNKTAGQVVQELKSIYKTP